MSPKIKTKEDTPKTTLTAPTPSEQMRNFKKRMEVYELPPWKRSATKSSMSSKEWREAFDGLDTMMSEEQGKETSANF